jgi:flagellar biosynthesis chaperone FliJ|tara:strand:- start:292 stop:537 length:246 start_codon:yes stop_codon:yes gene_type:complete
MTKITEAEIKKVNDLKIQFSRLVETMGSIEVQIMQLQLQKEELKVSLLDIKKGETTLATELEEKYGKGTISLDTGKFSPDE